MATLRTKKLQQALQKARNVGRVEEAVRIGGCSIVLQNLAPEDYESIIRDTGDLEGAEYLHAYQIGHVSRAVVEIEGVDLRGIDFVEEEVPAGCYVVNAVLANDAQAEKVAKLLSEMGVKPTIVPPDADEEVRTVRLERADWIQRRLATWGREAISVAYRKFADLLVRAEEQAQEGVQFRIVDESNEDKFRRLLTEAKELEDGLPRELVDKILGDAGYVPGSTPQEIAEVAKRAKEFADERAQATDNTSPNVEDEAPEVEEPRTKTIRDLAHEINASREAVSGELPATTAAVERRDPHELMRLRQPLNRVVTQPPAMVSQSYAAAVQVPAQIREAATTLNSERAAQIAALEAQLEPGLGQQAAEERALQREIPELSRKAQPVDPTVLTIIDTKPVAGLNPKFRNLPK